MSHYSMGYTDYIHRGYKVRSSVGNSEADKFIEDYNTENQDSGFVPPDYANRPDRMAEVFYGGPDYFWLVCLSSNKFDVFEDFDVGSRVGLPND